jgi:transposase
MSQFSSQDTVAELRIRISELEGIIASLCDRISELELKLAQAQKNSGNSSKPPSSDITKVKASKPGGRKRKKGAQPGHEAKFREPFAADEIDEYRVFDPPSLSCACGGHLAAAPESDRVRQQIELPDKPVKIIELRGRAYRCGACGKMHYGFIPREHLSTGLIGPNLAAALAFIKVKAHSSYTALSCFMGEVLACPVSRGELAKTFQKISAALKTPYEEALQSLPQEPVLNIDETGHKENGGRFWTWVFRASLFAVFRISAHRSSEVLKSVLGLNFSGLIGCDYFSAYHKYLKACDAEAQFCLAHFIRDVRFLSDSPKAPVKEYGLRLLARLRRLFRLHHRAKEEPALREKLRSCAERLRAEALNAPKFKEAENLAKRFSLNGDSYLRFISNPELDPTNNVAEQTIRFVVLDRAVTQGTRSESGRNWSERIWTANATCSMRKYSLFKFLQKAINAFYSNQQAPSLINL